MPDESEARKALKSVVDPELGVNIIDLGLVYGIEIADSRASVKMTLTSVGCPLAPYFIGQVQKALARAGFKKAEVEIVWIPPWTRDRMSADAKAQLGLD